MIREADRERDKQEHNASHGHPGTKIQSLLSLWTKDLVDEEFDVTSVAETLSQTQRGGEAATGAEWNTKQSEAQERCDTLASPEASVIPTALVQPKERKETISAKGKILEALDDWLRRKLQYLYVLVMLYAMPVCVAMYASPSAVSTMYYLSIACVVFVNFWMVLEGVFSFHHTANLRKLHNAPSTLKGERTLGSIVVAYLPNELTVLVDTLRAVAMTVHELPEGTTLDIVLAHNGGKKEQRIALLQDLRMIEAELPVNVCVHELHVLSSRSKAENVNAALAFLEELGGAVRGRSFTQLSMYDADHQPIPQAWRYALETMQDQQADMVMGRCCVRDGLKYVAIEFDILYAVAHAGGRCVRGFGFFGGSNGYWDYRTLVETGMDKGMLTEDVDSSFRAQAAGHRMTYDSTIVSYEESPPDFSALFKQRLRWAQGWYEVTIRQFFLPFRQAPGLTLWSRFCIFLLLHFREVYVYLSSFTMPITVVYLTRACGWTCVDYRLLALMLLGPLVPIVMALVAWYLTKDQHSRTHHRMPGLTSLDYFRYIIIYFPYEFVKLHIAIMAHARHALGLNQWVVTKRKTTKDSMVQSSTVSLNEVAYPEELVENSPFAPMIRRLYTGTFDESRDTAICHSSTVGYGNASNSNITFTSSGSEDNI